MTYQSFQPFQSLWTAITTLLLITYISTSSVAPSFPDMSSDVRWGKQLGLDSKSVILNFGNGVVVRIDCTLWNESSETSRCTSLVSSHSTGTISQVWAARKQYIDKYFIRSLHFLNADISSIGVPEISRFSSFGKSSAIISNPCLLNSVRLTLRLTKFLNLDNETTTQNFVLFKNVLLLTFKERRFVRLHSPKHPITSLIVTLFNPVTSRSDILCCFNVRNPFVDSWASRIQTRRKFITLASNRVSVSSLSLPFSHSASRRFSDRWCWKYMSCSLNINLCCPNSVTLASHSKLRLSHIKSTQHSCRLTGVSYIVASNAVVA